MSDPLVQIPARLTLHEFALEVMMANFLASMPEETVESFLEDFRKRARNAWTAQQIDEDDETADLILQTSIRLTDNLVRKVADRVSNIRELEAQAHLQQ